MILVIWRGTQCKTEEIRAKLTATSWRPTKWLCIADREFVGRMNMPEFVDLLQSKSWSTKHTGHGQERHCYLDKMRLQCLFSSTSWNRPFNPVSRSEQTELCRVGLVNEKIVLRYDWIKLLHCKYVNKLEHWNVKIWRRKQMPWLSLPPLLAWLYWWNLAIFFLH